MSRDHSEFWEASFKDKQSMWGFQPANSAILAVDLFKANQLTSVLIPGFGYGRNGKVFYDNGIAVTGIEVSATAINIAKTHFGNSMKIYHGNVMDMPFDNSLYYGIFCYALIHLLDEQQRNKLIENCYQQLKTGGLMVFVALSTSTATYGQGINLSPNRFTSKHGVNLFYYDEDTISAEFSDYGLLQASEIKESSQTFYFIVCKK